MKLSAIILAGGLSTRMTFNKEYLQLNGEYVVHQQIKQLQPLFDEIIVVSPHPEQYSGLNVVVVSDILEGNSPIIGLHAGLFHAHHDYAFVIACDMPFINSDYIKYLTQQIDHHDAYVVKRNRFIEPFQAIYHKRILPLIETLVKEQAFGFQHMITKTNHYTISEKEIAPFLLSQDLFKNINTPDELQAILEGTTKEYRMLNVTKLQGNDTYTIPDKVITEYPLSIYVNQEYLMTMMTTPTNLEYLVIGILFNEGIIEKITEISSLSITLQEHRAEVVISKEFVTSNTSKITILSSACGGRGIPSTVDTSTYLQTDKYQYSIDTIISTISRFNKASSLFKETGGVHSVLLCIDNQEVLMEDIGRHNAIDKVVGYLLKHKLQNQKVFVCTSGRISSDILLKCAKAGIPLIVSRSAPTSLAVHLATDLNMTVIGFARGTSVNIYAGPNRVLKEEKS